MSVKTIKIHDTGKGLKSVKDDLEAVLRKIEGWHQGSIAGFLNEGDLVVASRAVDSVRDSVGFRLNPIKTWHIRDRQQHAGRCLR
jgi:hypothetical protein